MKLIKAVARKKEEKEKIEDVLDEKNIVSYNTISKRGFYKFEITAVEEEVDPLIKELKDIGLGKSFKKSITVLDVKASVPDRRTKERLPRISSEELEEDIKQYSEPNWVYLGFVSLSAIIVSLGLLGQNLIVVIGGMVVAPLLYPMIGNSYFLLRKEYKKEVQKIIRSEFIGISLTVIWGILTALVIRSLIPSISVTSIISMVSTITLFDIGIAVFAGAAGALSVSTRNLGEFSGVAIAVALVPPATTIGIGLTLLNWNVLLGALKLTLVNLSAVHITSLIVFKILKYGRS